MKMYFTLFLCLLNVSLFAQSDARFQQAMEQVVLALEEAEDVQSLQQTANQLERIAQAEPTEWLPLYYLGYSYLNMAMKSGGPEAAGYLELAQQQLDKLKKMQPRNSEVHTLQGYKHMIYVSADPASRGADYTPLTMGAFHQAIALNPENPRAYLLMGQMQYGVAHFFGSSTEDACRLLQKAVQLYEQQEEEELLPHWGAGSAINFAKRCGGGQVER